MHHRIKSFMGGLMVDTLGMPLTMALGILVTPIYLRYITVNEYGYWTTVLDFMSFLNILNAGIGIFIVQTISKEKIAGIESIKKSLSSIVAVQSLIICIMLLSCIIVFLTIPSFQNSSNKIQGSHQIFGLMTINLIVSTVIVWFTNILYGQNRVSISNGLGLAQKTLTQLLPLLLLISGLGLVSFAISFLATSILLIIVSFFLTYRYLKPRIFLDSVKVNDVKAISLFSLRYLLGSTSYYVLHFTDTIIIANFISTARVTIYVLTMKLAFVAKLLPGRIISQAFPSLTQLIQEESYYRLHEVTKKLFKVSLRIGLFSSGVIIFLNQIFVTHWVGADKFGGNILSFMSALFCMREAIMPVFISIIFSTKKIKTINLILFFEAFANIAFSIIFLKFWGINGVALASILSSSFLSVGYSWYKASKIIHTSPRLFIPPLLMTTIKFIPTFSILWFGMTMLKSDFSWFLFIAVIIVAAISNSICFEGRTIIKHRKLPLKEIVGKVINEA